MQNVKTLWVLTVAAVLAVLVGGYMFLVQPQSEKAAELRAEAETKRAANAQVQRQIDLLKEKAKDLPREQARLAEIAQKIPNNPAEPAFIRAFTDAAALSKTEVLSFKADAPQLLNVTPPGGAVAPAAGTTATGTGATGTGATTGTRPGGATATDGMTIPTPNLAFIKVELRIQGTYSQLEDLLSSFEGLPRAVLIGDIHIEPAKRKGPDGGKDVKPLNNLLDMKIGGRLFMTTTAGNTAPTRVTTPTSSTTN